MKKKMFLAIASITLIIVVAVGCTKAHPTSPSTSQQSPAPITTTGSNIPIEPVPSQSPVDSNIPETPSSTLLSVLPLNISEPVDAATLTTNTVTVKGQTQPGATLSVNDQMGIADDQGNFNVPISLDDGIGAIDIIAIDDNGNQGEVLLLVNVVSSGPPSDSLGPSSESTNLKVFSPQDGASVYADNVTVTGQAAPGAMISVNDQFGAAGSNGNFSISVALTEGPNVIDVLSTDDDGNQDEIILLVENGLGT